MYYLYGSTVSLLSLAGVALLINHPVPLEVFVEEHKS